MATNYGAELRFEESLITWEPITTKLGQDLIKVTTDKGVYWTKKLLLSVGPWAPAIYGRDIPSVPLVAERRVLYWFEVRMHTFLLASLLPSRTNG